MPDDMDDAQSKPEIEDPMEQTQPEAPETTEDSSPLRTPRSCLSTPGRHIVQPETTPSLVFRAFNGMPSEVHPHVISSPDTSQDAVHRRLGNTAVRRKNVSRHSVIAEATKATGAVMAAQIQEIADASRELERSKIEVQLKLFTKEMEYQREKDKCIYENAAIPNENARLAIMKQGEMVSCLSELSSVLNTGLSMSSKTYNAPMQAHGQQAFPRPFDQ